MGVTLYPQLRSTERCRLVLNSCLHFPLLFSLARWNDAATAVGLPFSVKSLWKHPRRQHKGITVSPSDSKSSQGDKKINHQSL